MIRLEDKLQDAAQGPVRFDHHDVARRVRSRRRNRLVGAGAVAVFAVVGVVAGLVVSVGDEDERLDTAGHGGMVTVDELVADRWIVFAYSDVTVGIDPPPFIDFGEDGQISGIDGCSTFTGTWELDGSRLNTSMQSVETSSSCVPAATGLAQLLVEDPMVDRFDEGSDNLRLTSGDDFFGFQRFDRVGEVPTGELLEGDWAATADATVSFDGDGSGIIELLGCSKEFTWTLDGDRIDVEGLPADGLPCDDGGGVGGGALLALSSSPRVRVVGPSMWISADDGIAVYSKVDGPGPTPTMTSSPDAEPALSPDYVTASSDGVTLHDSAGHTTGVADGATAVAFAVGPDLIVYQPASAAAGGYPLIPDGDPVVWSSGEQRSLPVDTAAFSALLLDASMVDGRPVALVSESFGGVGPDDTFEELVLFDLESLERTTIVRREAWESGHFDAQLRPDGDVVALLSAEALTLLTRWSPGSDSAEWTVELGTEIRAELTMYDGEIRVVDAGFTSELEPILAIHDYSVEGILLDEAAITIDDPDGELGSGLFCTDWYDDARLVCGRGDGPPIIVDVKAGSFAQLDGPVGGYPTIVRSG